MHVRRVAVFTVNWLVIGVCCHRSSHYWEPTVEQLQFNSNLTPILTVGGFQRCVVCFPPLLLARSSARFIMFLSRHLMPTTPHCFWTSWPLNEFGKIWLLATTVTSIQIDRKQMMTLDKWWQWIVTGHWTPDTASRFNNLSLS